MRTLYTALLFVLAAMSGTANAAVILTLTDNDVSPTYRTASAGSTFVVTASISANQEQLTGVDYYLSATSGANFKIVGRDTGGSQFSDTVRANIGSISNPGVLDNGFNSLSPRNALDLGASIGNVNSPLSAGTYKLADFTIEVPAATLPGTYFVSTVSEPGTGWVAGPPLFEEGGFTSHGMFQVDVVGVPEPSSLLLVGLGVVALWRKRR
jgi:hypothetical protein